MMEGRRAALLYWLLLALHAAGALTILGFIHGAFRALIDSIGQQQPISPADLLRLGAAVAVCQFCYWFRFYRLPVPAGRHILAGHALVFASKIGFIFGGALFSLFFLRHLPELSLSHQAFGLAWRGAIVVATLFALYCFTLELERLGNALQQEADRG
jgi:hypothetical protein